MAFLNEFLNGGLPYQSFWLPVIIGVVAGMACLFVGRLVGRGNKPSENAAVNPGAVHDPFTQGSLTEKRRSLRRAGNPVEVLYARMEDKNPSNSALVLDRSLGGLRLVAEEDMPTGTQLRLLPANASEQTPWVDVEILGTRQVDDSWELHCRFLKTPQWSILLLFG